MKYIRTKDGVYEVIKKVEFPKLPINASDYDNVYYFVVGGNVLIRESEIVEQADTIEELCDFIFFKYWSTIRKCYELKLYKSLKELYANEYITGNDKYFIYGAIWTDKGLIYVAKMNDKGELELL